jgi:beta-glucosidase
MSCASNQSLCHFAALASMFFAAQCQPGSSPPAPKAPIAPAIAVTSMANPAVAPGPAAIEVKASYAYPFLDPSLSPADRAKDLVSRLTLDEKLAQMMHDTPAIERLGIPAYSWWNEALHGVARGGRATVFPQAIGMAATFDDQLLGRVASAISDEARVKFNGARAIGNTGRYAGLSFWSPNINIFRDPRWGRGQETYGEDPYLTSRMGVAFVRGMQGNDPKYLKTAACAKHFAVHSGPEASRHVFDATPSKKDLVETYLPAFEALVREGHVAGVMSAYNRVYGEPASGSKFLLEDLLRKQWGFDGYVVSDCWALLDFHQTHKVTKTPSQSAAKALLAGVNLNCGSTYPFLKQAHEEKRVTLAQIDASLAKLLETRFRLGLFDAKTPFDALPLDVVASPEHARLSQEVASKSIVLLKNDRHILPLKKNTRRIMLLGPYVSDGNVLLGNYYGSPAQMTTLLEGVTAKVGVGSTVEYKNAFLADRPNVNPMDWATDDAQTGDAIIITLGLSGLIEGEEGAANASDFKGDRRDLALPKPQIDYLKKLRRTGKVPIVAVVFAGSPIALGEVSELVDAILFAWYPGQEGGAAIADVLFGDVSPSGRLPITFPKSASQLPPFSDYNMDRRGYRFMKEEPLYPFGFGLSYSSITYESLAVGANRVKAGENLRATVTVKNSGAVATDEVVQLYLTDIQASTRVPLAQLVGFSRVRLNPGEAKAVAFEVPARSMQIVADDGQRRYEAGEFRLTAGGSSPSPRVQVLGGSRPVTASFELEVSGATK